MKKPMRFLNYSSQKTSCCVVVIRNFLRRVSSTVFHSDFHTPKICNLATMCIVLSVMMILVSGGVGVIASSMDLMISIYSVSNTGEDTLYGTAPIEFNTMIYGQTTEELRNARVVSVEIYNRHNKLIHREFYLNRTSEIEEGYSIQFPYYVSDKKIADFEYGKRYMTYITIEKGGKRTLKYREFDVKPSLSSPSNMKLDISDINEDPYNVKWSSVAGADGYVIYVNDNDGVYFGGADNNDYCATTKETTCSLDLKQLRLLDSLEDSPYAYIYVVAYLNNGYFKVIDRSDVTRINIQGNLMGSSLTHDDAYVLKNDWVENDRAENEIIYNDIYISDTLDEMDAKLKEVFINGDNMVGFSPDIMEYTVILPGGTKTVPVISANSLEDGGVVYISNADSLPGTTRTRVNSQDGNRSSEYKFNFMVARGKPGLIGSLTLSEGILYPPFMPNISTYDVVLPRGSDIPEIKAVPSEDISNIEIIPAKEFPGKTLVNVKDEDGSILNTYTVNFRFPGENPLSRELIWTLIVSLIAVFAIIMSMSFYIKLKKLKKGLDVPKA